MLHLTARNFESETTHTHLPVVIMFYANWCGKCAMMKPVFEDIEKKYLGKIKFFEVEIDEAPDLAARYDAGIVPTFLLLKNKTPIATLQGLIPQPTLDQRIQKLLLAPH